MLNPLVKRLGATAFLLCLWVVSAFAQPTVITGKVTDNADGSPLIGANILIIGRNLGASTSIDGSYRITVQPGTYQLRASYVGYKTKVQAITVNRGSNLLNFTLDPDYIGVDEVVAIGTRRDDRTVVDSPVPIDVISARDIEATGAVETTQMLQILVPSFSAPQPSISDGSDHVRPATMRGLAPDQTLVLINGKRLHSTALVHVNGTVGRGSSGPDLNSIPASAIERIEVLRDGASAQYGSDAIAGVINIILKSKTGFDAKVNVGSHYSSTVRGYTGREGDMLDANGSSIQTLGSYNFDDSGEEGTNFVGQAQSVNFQDGRSADLHLGYGLKVGEKGNLYISAQLRDRDDTNRAALDPRRNYAPTSGTANPLESTYNRLNHRYGNGQMQDISIYLNGRIPLNDTGTNFYTNGGINLRDGLSGCFFRRASDARNDIAIYPNGFLPQINATVQDARFAFGVSGVTNNWKWDISETFGSNGFDFNMKEVLNRSISATDPRQKTEIYSGSLKFGQATTNLDAFRQLSIGTASPLNLAIGGEFRFEQYEIIQGEEVSYLDGNTVVAGTRTTLAPGCQCFPGFKPVDAGKHNRTSFGFYLDAENNISEKFLLSAATRFENYSDFGSNFSWKVASRYEPINGFAIRGAISTGFKAPSLQQQNFSATSTNFINGIPYDIKTFPVNSAGAIAMGAQPLKAETSQNISAGITVNKGDFSLTADAYQIKIKDRITFSNNFLRSTSTTQFNALLDGIQGGLGGGRFFSNAINTTTKGLDVTAKYGTKVGEGTLRVLAALNLNETEVDNAVASATNAFIRTIPANATLQNLGFTSLFGRDRLADYEVANPTDKESIQLQYDLKKVGFLLRGTRYGEVWEISNRTTFGGGTTQTSGANAVDPTTGYNPYDQKFSAKGIFDLEINARPINALTIALGANNIFDIYPDKRLKENSFSGITPYSGYSPFGFFGRYVFTRLTYSL